MRPLNRQWKPRDTFRNALAWEAAQILAGIANVLIAFGIVAALLLLAMSLD
jgi:hypothetical protein